MMPEPRFWEIIESSRARALEKSGDEDFAERHMDALREAMKTLSTDDLSAFDARMRRLHADAYRWDLWGAAYWLGGGCSDDGFMDFRYCLITLGRELYTRILADPDALSETVDRDDVPYMQSEGFQYIVREVYEERTGMDLPEPDPSFEHPREPVGESFDFDDAEIMRKHYPRLTRRLPDGGD